MTAPGVAGRDGAARQCSRHGRFFVGEAVEVVDLVHSLRGKRGTVVLFAGDNIFVEFPDLRRAPTKLFFPEQLRSLLAPKPTGPLAQLVGLISRSMKRGRP